MMVLIESSYITVGDGIARYVNAFKGPWQICDFGDFIAMESYLP